MSIFIAIKLPLVVANCIGAANIDGVQFRLDFNAAPSRVATPAEIAQAQTLVDQDVADTLNKSSQATAAKASLAQLQADVPIIDAIINAGAVLSLLALQQQVKDLAKAAKNANASAQAVIAGSLGK